MLDADCQKIKQYGRPIYTFESSISLDIGDAVANITTSPGSAVINQAPLFQPPTTMGEDKSTLIYTGSRWIGVVKRGAANLTFTELKARQADYHAFWERKYYFVYEACQIF